MEISDQDSRLSIERLERLPEGGQSAGDVRARIVVKAMGFTGEYEEVWFEDAALVAFVDELLELGQKRSGIAELRSVSPDEFQLRVTPSGNMGRVVAEGELRRTWLTTMTVRMSSVCFEIDVDPSSLGEMVDAIRRLRVAF